MIVLGLDTTGPDCSVSLVNDATVLAHASRRIGRGHAEVLAGMVAELFTLAELAPDAVDRLAVCTGPGSFTGLRVALSFAIGFALPRDLPVVGINALAVCAEEAIAGGPDKAPNKLAGLFYVYRDVRRDQFMCALYNAKRRDKADEAPILVTSAEMQALCDEIQSFALEAKMVDTRILAWLAMDVEPEDFPPAPLYARGPDAKLPGGKSP